jgi:hypothetical protein
VGLWSAGSVHRRLLCGGGRGCRFGGGARLGDGGEGSAAQIWNANTASYVRYTAASSLRYKTLKLFRPSCGCFALIDDIGSLPPHHRLVGHTIWGWYPLGAISPWSSPYDSFPLPSLTTNDETQSRQPSRVYLHYVFSTGCRNFYL